MRQPGGESTGLMYQIYIKYYFHLLSGGQLSFCLPSAVMIPWMNDHCHQLKNESSLSSKDGTITVYQPKNGMVMVLPL